MRNFRLWFSGHKKGIKTAAIIVWGILLALIAAYIVINALVVFNNGCLEGIFDDELYYRDGKVYLESDIWFSSDVNVKVYESENIFFVRLVDEYNRPASDEFAR